MMPGMPERRTHDYGRHGITSLFAAFNIADGTVIGELHRQHRATEFEKFLITIDKAFPAELDIHLICDNFGTHKAASRRTPPAPIPRWGCPGLCRTDVRLAVGSPRGVRSPIA